MIVAHASACRRGCRSVPELQPSRLTAGGPAREPSARAHRRLFLLALLAPAILFGQAKKEDPVGLVLLPAGGKVVRGGSETEVAGKSGDILFSGDALRSAAAPMSFLFCPGKTSQSLAPGGEVILDPKALKVKTGKLADQKPVASCFLPQMVRVSAASQQHYGISMTRGTGDPPPPLPADKLPPAVVAELAPLDKALAADPQDMGSVVARAAIFEKHNLLANAVAEYKKIGAEWKDAVWVKKQIFELQEKLATQAAEAAATAPTGGTTYAIAVGVSKYQKLPQDLWLQYAHADAGDFTKLLLSPRGGGLPPENVLSLTDEKATTAALRTAFNTFLKARAGKKDTVIVLIAGHGTVEVPGSKGAFILTHDADPQDLSATALPMADVQNLIQEQTSKVARVVFFVDACRSGTIGTIKNTMINSVVEKLAEAEGEIFGLMASRPKELSYEGPQFGGGHGAFSYFLIKGLNGEADKNGDGRVNVNELIEYVRTQVAAGTEDKQHPRDFGTMDNAVPLSDVKKPGIQLAIRRSVMLDFRGEPALFAAAGPPQLPASESAAQRRFTQALAAGRILPEEPESAFAALRDLERELTREQYQLKVNELRIALEDRGQQVLLKYLAGEAVPQTRKDFESGATYMQAAAKLTPESLYLEGRDDFFRGRTLLFDKKYPEAADLLERSAAIDPNGAYSYNALGIAYLEQADYKRAAAAFRDANRRAVHWAYPLHNLALTYMQTGQYENAIRTYQEAMRRAPSVAYLPYNLGLVYQKTNRRKEAEAAFRRASSLNPDSGEPYNALGALKASMGKSAEAEQLYRQALQKNPDLLPARHNLADLLARRKDGQKEAFDLWRANLKQAPDHMPSHLGLAETLAAQGDTAGAIEEYRTILQIRPEYVAARLVLAGLLEKSGNRDAARAEIAQALKAEPESPAVLERLGDLEAAAGRQAEAAKAYQAALDQSAEGAARKRLSKKLKSSR